MRSIFWLQGFQNAGFLVKSTSIEEMLRRRFIRFLNARSLLQRVFTQWFSALFPVRECCQFHIA